MSSSVVNSEPIWFGPEQHPLFGWIHYPQSRLVRGGILLCPSLGIEGESSYLVFRELADLLSREEFLVLRFDYDGTGDSAGDQNDPDRLRAWLHSIYLAAHTIQATGVQHISVVGLRMGALLSAMEQNHHRLFDDVILWDPPLSGSSFLRQQFLLQLQVKAALLLNGQGENEILGMSLSSNTLEELASLSLANFNTSSVDRALILSRPDRPLPKPLHMELSGPHVSWGFTVGQSTLFEVPLVRSQTNRDDLSTIVNWLREGQTTTRYLCKSWHSANRPRVILSDSFITEFTTISKTTRTFFFTTATKLRPPNPPPLTIIFLNSGNLHHIGPARQWVQLSRVWASLGFQCIRLDLPGLGESRESNDTNTVVYPHNVASVLSDLFSSRKIAPSSALLVGLCSGADHALMLAGEMNLAGAFAINPSSRSYWTHLAAICICIRRFLSFTKDSPIFPIDSVATPPSRGPDLTVFRSVVRRLLDRSGSHHTPVLLQYSTNVIYELAWWFINSFIRRRHSTDALARIIHNGGRVLIIAAPDQACSIIRGERLRQFLEKRTGRLDINILPTLDHNLHLVRGREQASAIMTDYLLKYFGSERSK